MTGVPAAVPRSWPSGLLSDLAAAVEPLLSLPAPANDVHAGYRQVVVVDGGRVVLPQFAELGEAFAPVRSAWLSWIEPGGYVVEHVDAGPHFERWQIPFTAGGRLVQDGEPVDHEVGVPFRVRHDRWHSVENQSDHPRVSLVIDRDVVVSTTRTPFLRR